MLRNCRLVGGDGLVGRIDRARRREGGEKDAGHGKPATFESGRRPGPRQLFMIFCATPLTNVIDSSPSFGATNRGISEDGRTVPALWKRRQTPHLPQSGDSFMATTSRLFLSKSIRRKWAFGRCPSESSSRAVAPGFQSPLAGSCTLNQLDGSNLLLVKRGHWQIGSGRISQNTMRQELKAQGGERKGGREGRGKASQRQHPPISPTYICARTVHPGTEPMGGGVINGDPNRS